MSEVIGFVAAGGRSSRMGKNKAWLDLAGRPIIEHVIAALKPVTTGIAIVANDPEYKRLGYPVFMDSQIGIGPLEAIRTALRNSPGERIVLASCDIPFATSELFRFLLTIAEDSDVVVPLSGDERLEPLCAVYRTRVLTAVEKLIASGERKISPLFDSVAARFVRFEEFRHLAGSESFFMNINTPEDYERANSIISQEPGIGQDRSNPKGIL